MVTLFLTFLQIAKWSILERDFSVASGELSKSVPHSQARWKWPGYEAELTRNEFSLFAQKRRLLSLHILLPLPPAPTLKMKRMDIMLKYADCIDSFYSA